MSKGVIKMDFKDLPKMDFKDLPDDVILNCIIPYIDTNDIGNLSMCSKFNRQYFSSNDVWKKVYTGFISDSKIKELLNNSYILE